jgi:hypothetical protein
VRDKASHPDKTTGKIIVLSILIFMFLGSKWEDKGLWTERCLAFTEFKLILISTFIQFLIVIVVPNI